MKSVSLRKNSKNFIKVMLASSFIVGCSSSSGGGGSNSPTPVNNAALVTAVSAVVPVVNGSQTLGYLPIENIGNVAVSNVSVSTDSAQSAAIFINKLKSLFGKSRTVAASDGFQILNANECSTIQAHSSCTIKFKTPALTIGDSGSSLIIVSAPAQANLSATKINNIINYSYLNTSVKTGVNFYGNLNLNGKTGSTQYGVAYLYAGGTPGTIYRNVNLNISNPGELSIKDGFVASQEVAAGQVLPIEVQASQASNQNTAIIVTPIWNNASSQATPKSNKRLTGSGGGNGDPLVVGLTPSATASLSISRMPLFTIPNPATATIYVTNNGTVDATGFTATLANSSAVILNQSNCTGTTLLANARNSCSMTVTINSTVVNSGTTTISYALGATSVGSDTIVWTNSAPYPNIYLQPSTNSITMSIDNSQAMSFTVNNVGKGPLNNVNYAAYSSGSTNFTPNMATSTCGATIAAESQCSISGIVTSGSSVESGSFYLSANGILNSTGYNYNSLPVNFLIQANPSLIFTTPTEGDTVNLTILANNTQVESYVYVIKNVGDITANVSSISLTGTQPSVEVTRDNTIGNNCSSSLSPNASCNVKVIFGPAPYSNTANESGTLNLNLTYNGGSLASPVTLSGPFTYNLIGNDSSLGVMAVTASSNISGAGVSSDHYLTSGASSDPATLTLDYSNNSVNFAMTNFSIDTKTLPTAISVDPSSTCPNTSSGSATTWGTIESGASCSLVLSVNKAYLSGVNGAGSNLWNITYPTASWSYVMGSLTQTPTDANNNQNLYLDYLQATVTSSVSNNNSAFESTILTMTATNSVGYASLTANVAGVESWLTTSPVNNSSNCSINPTTYALSCDLIQNSNVGTVTYLMPTFRSSALTFNLLYSLGSSGYAYFSPSYTTVTDLFKPLAAYVTDTSGHNVYMCLIAGDGSITSCAISNGNGSGSNWTPYNIANNGGNYVYLTNDKNSGLVYRCNVNSTGNLQTCLSSNGGNSTWQPTGIALHGGFAYVLDYNASFVNKCNLESNGVISGCTQTGSGLTDGSNAYIYNIAFNGDYAYVTDSFYDNIYVAPVNSNGTIGAFVKAQNTLDANDIAFNTASNGVTYAYVASVGADAIQQCSIASDGVLTNCAYAISAGYPSGWTPSSIAFYNNTAYITDTSNDKIAVCPLNANGSFASCTETAGGASSWNPWSITIF